MKLLDRFTKSNQDDQAQVFDFIPSTESAQGRKERRAQAAEIRRTRTESGTVLPINRLPFTTFPKGGAKVPANLRGPSTVTPQVHGSSTLTYAAAYPFVSEGGLGAEGVYMGQDTAGGGAFCADPWAWYEKGFVSGTSIVLIGGVGTGKSTCAKTLVCRLVIAGRKAAVCTDKKGEWVRVARWLGGEVISVGPGRSSRINPLDEGSRPLLNSEDKPLSDFEWAAIVSSRRLALLGTLVSILLGGRMLEPAEHVALTRAVSHAAEYNKVPTIPHVISALKNPSEEVRAEIQDQGANLGHALTRCVTGDIAGMFDGESTVSFNPDAPIMVIDTSGLTGASSEAVSITSACTSAWVEAVVTNKESGQRVVVYEEGWDTLSDPAALERMVVQWKLAREYGITNLLILHKLADLDMAGDSGSKPRALAESLLTDAEIRIVYRQAPGALPTTKKNLGLTTAEAEKVSKLKKGQGLWKVGPRSFIVDNKMTAAERPVFDTDARMESK
ncbi:AAA-like domain-containing protein [Arthrobacter alpinus]|uniref:AAA-like domain-containing protein n=1 Tax=Arthrobacter alpinus TaxID=656366 RepID=A0A1H5PBP9_9MICC|nr:AAA-like domain-containing protein [Arthrobacter alpinus]